MWKKGKKGKAKAEPKKTVLESLEDELFDSPEDEALTMEDLAEAKKILEEQGVAEFTELNPDQIIKSTLDIQMSKEDKSFLDSIGFKPDWLASLANQFNFTSFKYIHKFRAFRCYRERSHLDWIDVNELGMYQNRKELTKIMQHYQPLTKRNKIITWR